MVRLSLSRLLALFTLLLAFAIGSSARAQPLDPKNVPEPLKPWTAWALHDSDDALCPTLQGQKDTSRCAWPSRLDLSVDEHAGHFTQKWHMDAAAWVSLPGDEKRWPLDVRSDGARAVVVAQASIPSVRLERGDHVVTGSFGWDSPPESLVVPPETGLLALSLRGVVIPAPVRDAQGSVFLQKIATAEEGEKLEIVAHRKLTDDIPLTLTTHLELDVAGKSREVLLGKALPPGFVPMSLSALLPARLEQDNRLRVQVRPGRWTIELVARSEGLVNSIARPEPGGPWREGEEVWTFEARPDFRLVDVHGASSIDPAQTSLPAEWKIYPAYPMKVGDVLTFEERRRGDAEPPPNQLTLNRRLWLDFDGSGYTISDSLSGTLNRDSRLEMDPPTQLGRVAIGGRDQFITHMGDSKQTGVEVRQGSLDVTADSRLVGNVSDIPAVGWKQDFHQVSGTLHLPPGWRLFHASGVDEVPSTWVRGWSLLQIFLALIAAITIGRLHGWRWGAIALVMLTLTLPEDGAPRWSWLFVLAAEALVRVLPTGIFQRIARVLRGGMVIIVALIAIVFLVKHVRQGMYPVLAFDTSDDTSEVSEQESDNREGGTGTRAKGEEGSMGNPNTNPTPMAFGLAAPADKEADRPMNGPTGGAGGTPQKQYAQFKTETYDPNAVVQTGPGLPSWTWTTIPLTWSGPVAETQRLRLWLVPPSINFALAFLRLVLVALVLLRMIPWTARFWPKGWGPAVATAIFALLFLSPNLARADMPDQATLDELRSRLLAKPDCLPDCASSSQLVIDIRAGVLQGRLEVDAAASTAVPLPGIASQWLPEDVAVDGQAARSLLRTTDGTLWVAVPTGSHQIVFQGRMPDRDSMQLPLPLKPHHVTVTAAGWEVAGVHEDNLADDNLQFSRIAGTQPATASLQPGALPPFVHVERTISIGLNWQVDTRVVRLTPTGSAVVLEVPLLPGESVTTADVRVVASKAQVNMAPQATEVVWHSVLEQKSPLMLQAPKSIGWTEVWRVDVGPIWHGSFSGIPAVHTAPASGQSLPEWRPWPGEIASVELSRPDGVPGQSLTIDSSELAVTPGLRATDATLTLAIRASRGATHVVTLPDGAQLESITVNGASQPVRQDGGKVTIAIVPGAQRVVLTWRQTPAIGFMYRSPEVDIGAPSVNSTVRVQPGSRWMLFVLGPRVGPAVLFWSGLIVLLFVAASLGRIRWTPLRWWHWTLLAIGLSQVPIVMAALFAGWLIALGWRKERAELSPVWFNMRQALLVFWTLVALGLLAAAIHQGLLGTPEMQLRGNGSSVDNLIWFSDRSDNTLPTALVVSVPMLIYRITMLAWALWVALALLRWLKWGWSAFSEGGFWKKLPSTPPRAYPAQYQQQQHWQQQAAPAGVPFATPEVVPVPVVPVPVVPAPVVPTPEAVTTTEAVPPAEGVPAPEDPFPKDPKT